MRTTRVLYLCGESAAAVAQQTSHASSAARSARITRTGQVRARARATRRRLRARRRASRRPPRPSARAPRHALEPRAHPDAPFSRTRAHCQQHIIHPLQSHTAYSDSIASLDNRLLCHYWVSGRQKRTYPNHVSDF